MHNNYIIINNRGAGDRIGAQLSWYICQLIYAHHNNYYIELVYYYISVTKQLMSDVNDAKKRWSQMLMMRDGKK